MKYILIIWCILLLGCGSKKKTVEVDKSVYKENKDLWQKRLDSLAKEIEFRNSILDLSIEPVDPKIPNKAKFTKTDDGFEFEGENSKVGYKEEDKDSTVTENKGSKEEMNDNSNIESSNKSIKKEKEEQGADTGDIKWTVWGIVVIVVGILIGVLYLKARGRKLF